MHRRLHDQLANAKATRTEYEISFDGATNWIISKPQSHVTRQPSQAWTWKDKIFVRDAKEMTTYKSLSGFAEAAQPPEEHGAPKLTFARHSC